MKISELQKELNKIKKNHGDLPVYIVNRYSFGGDELTKSYIQIRNLDNPYYDGYKGELLWPKRVLIG